VKYQFKVIENESTLYLQEELNRAGQEGFHVVGVMPYVPTTIDANGDEHSREIGKIIMQKDITDSTMSLTVYGDEQIKRLAEFMGGKGQS